MKRLLAAALILVSVGMIAPVSAFAIEHVVTSATGTIAKAPLGAGSTDSPPMLGQASSVDAASLLHNHLSFGAFETGDICVAFSNPIGHAGLFDGALYHGSVLNYCMRSANVSPYNGVQLEQPAKYQRYAIAVGLWVPAGTLTDTYQARDFCRNQQGEPYDLYSSKTDYTRWYCSKLVWAAWKHAAGVDLDASGGYFVSPLDLYNDAQTRVFARSAG